MTRKLGHHRSTARLSWRLGCTVLPGPGGAAALRVLRVVSCVARFPASQHGRSREAMVDEGKGKRGVRVGRAAPFSERAELIGTPGGWRRQRSAQNPTEALARLRGQRAIASRAAETADVAPYKQRTLVRD